MLKIEHDLNFKVSLGLEPLKNILVVLMILGAGAACGSKTNASAGAAAGERRVASYGEEHGRAQSVDIRPLIELSTADLLWR